MFPDPLIIVDLETTGISPARDRVLEVGLCEVRQGEVVAHWQSLVNPGRPVPPFITRLTGIDDALLQGAPRFAELAPELHRRLCDGVVVAHNARFDTGFLQQEFARLGLDLAPPVLCSMKLSRALYPRERRHGLDALIERHGLATRDRHRALGDALALWAFLEHVQETMPRDAVERALQAQL